MLQPAASAAAAAVTVPAAAATAVRYLAAVLGGEGLPMRGSAAEAPAAAAETGLQHVLPVWQLVVGAEATAGVVVLSAMLEGRWPAALVYQW